jgi:glyoxylase-like metal-dependent hydrolase (beta-lactamase superfamily II)
MTAQPSSLTASAPGFLSWTTYLPEAKVNGNSHAYLDGNKVILVDPTLPNPEVEAGIKKLGTPIAIILTSGNHERATAALRERYTVPVASGVEAVKELSFKPHVPLDMTPQIHALEPVSLAGAAKGEYALHCKKNKVLIVGDALLNLDTGLTILPDKYCTDPKKLRESLQKLLALEFDHILFAHGAPLSDNPRAKLKALLA